MTGLLVIITYLLKGSHSLTTTAQTWTWSNGVAGLAVPFATSTRSPCQLRPAQRQRYGVGGAALRVHRTWQAPNWHGSKWSYTALFL